MNYGDYDEEQKKATGQEIHPLEAKITTGQHRKYIGPTDHPRTCQHLLPHLLAWQANCNTQCVIDEDFIALMK